jgi:hypothetical protein
MAAPPEPITPPRAHSLDSEGPELGEKGSTEDDSSESPAVSWMLRVRSRNDELKRFFGLPPTEVQLLFQPAVACNPSDLGSIAESAG